jgi:hypothetical protein
MDIYPTCGSQWLGYQKSSHARRPRPSAHLIATLRWCTIHPNFRLDDSPFISSVVYELCALPHGHRTHLLCYSRINNNVLSELERDILESLRKQRERHGP